MENGDVKTRRVADVGSDHNLLIGKLALKLRKAKTGEKKKERFDTTKLQNPETKQQFTIALKNSFGILQKETEMTIQFQHGHGASSARLQKSKERAVDFHINLGQNRPKERNKEKAAHHKVPKTQRKTFKTILTKRQRSKTEYQSRQTHLIENLAEDTEAAARRKDMKLLYQITKKLKGDTGPNQNLPLKDADGKIITVEKEKIERWKEHFQQVLNRADPPRLADIPEAADDLEINLDQITEAEVREAIKAQKNGKAPGSDSVCAEMLKADEQETPRILRQIFQRIWDEEDTPDDWKTGTIIKLLKKGDLGNCNNWRGITLLSMTCKIFSRIILK